jgi:hypothetical protein
MNEVENSQTVQSEVKKEKPKLQPKPKTKQSPQTAEPKPATFPAKEFVNQWGFIHLSREALTAFGFSRTSDNKKPYEKTNITIDMQEGAFVIRKV